MIKEQNILCEIQPISTFCIQEIIFVPLPMVKGQIHLSKEKHQFRYVIIMR